MLLAIYVSHHSGVHDWRRLGDGGIEVALVKANEGAAPTRCARPAHHRAGPRPDCPNRHGDRARLPCVVVGPEEPRGMPARADSFDEFAAVALVYAKLQDVLARS
jgi:hypothetical protein